MCPVNQRLAYNLLILLYLGRCCYIEGDIAILKLILLYFIMLLIKLFRIGPVTGLRLAVLDGGRGPIQLTEDL